MQQPYRRRTGLIYRRGGLGEGPIEPILDGGRDAPISARGKRLLWIMVGISTLVGIGLLVLTVLE